MAAQGYFELNNRPSIIAWTSVVGPKEGQGPLAKYFDEVLSDDTMGLPSYEKTESAMMRKAARMALDKAGLAEEDISVMLGGDLLNQIIGSGYAAREMKIPFLGLYGACSTMAESLLIGSLILSGGYGQYALCMTSSHFSSAERQYRFPLEHGNQRPPSGQWTVTGSGATVLTTNPGLKGPVIESVTLGAISDKGIKDVNNMGAAMAPAAAETITNHLIGSGMTPADYDHIITGDLGRVGSDILLDLLAVNGVDIQDRHFDCGCEIYGDMKGIKAGGSGCGCSAVVLNGYFIPKLARGELTRILFVATGALMSPTSSQQGESIPGIAHAVSIAKEGMQ